MARHARPSDAPRRIAAAREFPARVAQKGNHGLRRSSLALRGHFVHERAPAAVHAGHAAPGEWAPRYRDRTAAQGVHAVCPRRRLAAEATR
jgi:hypothetical protein